MVWELFGPGAMINYGSWFRLQVGPYFLEINAFSAGSTRAERVTLSHARGYFRVSRLSLYGLRKRRLLVESRYCQVTVTCETGLHVPIFHRVQKGLPLFLLFRFCLQLRVDEFYSCLGQTNGDKRLI